MRVLFLIVLAALCRQPLDYYSQCGQSCRAAASGIRCKPWPIAELEPVTKPFREPQGVRPAASFVIRTHAFHQLKLVAKEESAKAD